MTSYCNMASINGLQTSGLQVNTIDGLTTLYATSIYDNGVLVDPTAPPNIPVNPSSSTSVCFPIFTTNNGAQTSAVLLTDSSISTPLSYKPSTGNLYTYALQVGGGINAGFLPVGTPASTNYLGVDGAGNIVRSSVPTPFGVAVLSAGTSGSPQQFTGYDQFFNIVSFVSGFNFYSLPPPNTSVYLVGIDSTNTATRFPNPYTNGTSGSYAQWSGYNQFVNNVKLANAQFTALGTGTVANVLAIDAGGNVITTTATLNQTAYSTAGTAYIPFVTSSASGVFTPLIGTGLAYNPNTYQLTCTGINCTGASSIAGYAPLSGPVFTGSVTLPNIITFSTIPSGGTVSSFLAVTAAGQVITTTSSSVPTQINPTNLATGTLYPAFFSSHTGGASLTVYVDPTAATLSYAPATGTLTATAFVGPLTGAVTGALTGTVNGLTLGLGGGSVSSNIAIGSLAQSAVNTNVNNVAIGPSALTANTGGGSNIAIGQQALSGLITGGNNIAIGIQAGNNLATSTASANNIYIGTSTSASATVVSNEIVIGYNIGGLGANTVNLGSTTKTVYANNFNANTSVNTSALRSPGNMIITSGYGVGTANTIYFYANGTPLGSIDNTGWNLSSYTLFCSTITSQSTYDLILKGVSGYVNLLSNATTIAQITPTGMLVNNVKSFASTDLTLTGQSGNVNLLSNATTIAQITPTGMLVNNVKSFASTDLTLTGQSGNVNMVCGLTTVASFVNSGNPGLSTNAIRNLTATALLINGNGSGNILLQSSGTTVANVYSGGIAISNGGAMYSDYFSGTNNFATQYMASTSSVQYTALYNPRMANCVYNVSTWNTGGYHLFTAGTPTGSCYALAAYHNGSYGGIISLSPGNAWTTLELEGAQVNVFCYGALAVYTTGGAWVTVSDERIKTNIRPLKTDKSLQRVLQAQTMTYNKIHKDPIAPDSVRKIPHVGVIAQQVQKSNPHCISTWDDEGTEMYGVNYQDYTIHLIGGMQEQHKMILTLQGQVDSQQTTIQSMAQHITTLTDTLNKLLEKYPL
jgi:hypothetical protein